MTERKRDVRFALMDAAFAADRKFVRLARRADNPTEYAAAVGVFWLVLADARRSRSPDVNFGEYEEYADQVALLQECRLLTETGFDPGTFERWAPAYRSPWDEKRVREGTQGYAEVRATTPTSPHINSALPTNGNARANFMGWEPKEPNSGLHDGHHGPSCAVCAPLLPSEKGRPA